VADDGSDSGECKLCSYRHALYMAVTCEAAKLGSDVQLHWQLVV